MYFPSTFQHCLQCEYNVELGHRSISGLLHNVWVRYNQRNYFGELHYSPDTERTFILLSLSCTNVEQIINTHILWQIVSHFLLTKFEGDSGKKPHISPVSLPQVSFSFSPSVSSFVFLSSLCFLSFIRYFSISVPPCLPPVQLHSLTSQLKRSTISINCSNCVSPHKSPDEKNIAASALVDYSVHVCLWACFHDLNRRCVVILYNNSFHQYYEKSFNHFRFIFQSVSCYLSPPLKWWFSTGGRIQFNTFSEVWALQELRVCHVLVLSFCPYPKNNGGHCLFQHSKLTMLMFFWQAISCGLAKNDCPL